MSGFHNVLRAQRRIAEAREPAARHVHRDPVNHAGRRYPPGSVYRAAVDEFVALADEAGIDAAELLSRLQANESRRPGGSPTHYVSRNSGGAVFVKTADFFAEQGGLTQAWGGAWLPVTVDGDPEETIEEARRVGRRLLEPRGLR